MEAVRGQYFGGCGLNKADVLLTKKTYWFGTNQLGILLTELRTIIIDGFINANKKKTAKKNGTHDDSDEN